MKSLLISGALCAAIALAGCDYVRDSVTPDKRDVESSKAHAAAQSVNFSAGNAERDNILNRSKLVAQPDLLGYVVLITYGQPVAYFQVKGKVTSCGKRLETPVKEYSIEGDSGYRQGALGPAPSYDGTFGDTAPDCVFFYTINGQYVQWNDVFVYSDQPLTLNKSAAVMVTK